MDGNWLPRLYSSKLLSRIVHLSFHKLQGIPLRSFLTQCLQLRALHLVSSIWSREVAKDEHWSGMQLERLTFSPRPADHSLMLGTDLGALVREGITESLLHSLHFDPPFRPEGSTGFLLQLEAFLGAAPLVCSSLRHLSLGSDIWVNIFFQEQFAHHTPQLIPFHNLPHLQSLSITTPINSVLKPARRNDHTTIPIKSAVKSADNQLNCFCYWFCRHLTPENKLPLSFTEMILIVEVGVNFYSEDLTAAPLPPDLERILNSSQFRFTFILKTPKSPEEHINSVYWKGSGTLKLWGKDMFKAGKITFLQR
ncbi:hypothetical protein DL96DRAFT_1613864 [Flagelloscypha sp. PMI_526]|nr:hypothetical protein DL96DRAFT_1613864 [Flagelloscypha sp. PMI_526]